MPATRPWMTTTGALYTFTTRKAPRPPWFDDLESGAGDWTVVPDTVQART